MSLNVKSTANGFIHSVKVPRIYKTAASIVKRVVENGESIKDLVYNTRHKNIKGVYALVVETIKQSQTLDKLIKKSKLLEKEVRLEPWLARILLIEMLFRKKVLKGNCKPIQTILSHQKNLQKHWEQIDCNRPFVKGKTPRYVRVNTLLRTPDEVIKIFRADGWILLKSSMDYSTFLETIARLRDNEFARDFHLKDLLVFPSRAKFYNHNLYVDGSIILQDKASCLPVHLLQPPPYSTVLDMCAAPGMKTSQLSAVMRNKGQIYAVEMNSSRYQTLCKFIQSAGCTNVHTINMDALLIGLDSKETSKVDTSWFADVEYILVDPSCSGTGIVERKSIFINEETNACRLKKLCAFQFKLLMHALTKFPNAKRVVYSTCSTETSENEKVVEDVIRKLQSDEEVATNKSMPQFQLVNALEETWPRRGSDDFKHGSRCIYADPEQDLTNGFFVAVFEKLER